jgi:asparagine synthase (glutamine-hydrolysing)
VTTASVESWVHPLAARRQIGGVVGDSDELIVQRLRNALGDDGGVLSHATPVVADSDACELDGVPVYDWTQVVRCGRLGDVQGAFAVAWLDGETVHLARDAIGERSLFYCISGPTLAFASTVRALVASRAARPAIDARSVAAYLSYGYVPGRRTLAEGVRELLPGEHVAITNGRVRSEALWELPPEDDPRHEDDEYVGLLHETLTRAVTRRLPEGGPLAATLSGGIDSSLVVALARRHHLGELTAFSVAFGRRLPNELEYARLVARYCGVRHRVVDLTPRIVMDRFDRTLASLSTPIGEPLTVANALLFEETAAYAPVVLNGEGGDPCFGGPKNVPMLLHALYGATERAAFHLERSYLHAHRKSFDELSLILSPAGVELLRAEPLERQLSRRFNDPRWSSLVNLLTAANVTLKGGHHILPKVDHLSRAAGTLGRSPLFDRAVVAAAVRMPADLKLRGTAEKWVLKQVAADLLPPTIVDRRKSGMRVPVEAWLEGKFERFARERILDGLAPYGLFRLQYLEQLVGRREGAVPRRGAKTWLLLSLEAWLRTVLS